MLGHGGIIRRRSFGLRASRLVPSCCRSIVAFCIFRSQAVTMVSMCGRHVQNLYASPVRSGIRLRRRPSNPIRGRSSSFFVSDCFCSCCAPRMFAYTLRDLQQLSAERQGLVLPRLPSDHLWTFGKAFSPGGLTGSLQGTASSLAPQEQRTLNRAYSLYTSWGC